MTGHQWENDQALYATRATARHEHKEVVNAGLDRRLHGRIRTVAEVPIEVALLRDDGSSVPAHRALRLSTCADLASVSQSSLEAST